MSITEIYEGDNSSVLSEKVLLPNSGISKSRISKSRISNSGISKSRISKSGIETTRIYVIRHAEGEHNTHQIKAKFLSSYTDPELTTKGIEQSKAAGKIFKKYLDKNSGIKIHDLFVSNLQRSYFTLYYFLSQQLKLASRLGIRTDTDTYSAKFIVLPNSEEVSRFNFGYENTTRCNLEYDTNVCRQYIHNISNFHVGIDWQLWFLHQNMFGLIFNDAYNTIYSKEIPIEDIKEESMLNGGKRRVKKTRRRRRKYRKQSRRYK